ncbi:hypothetical protein LXL04_039599 [Taraxacum kok-saghyz]
MKGQDTPVAVYLHRLSQYIIAVFLSLSLPFPAVRRILMPDLVSSFDFLLLPVSVSCCKIDRASDKGDRLCSCYTTLTMSFLRLHTISPGFKNANGGMKVPLYKYIADLSGRGNHVLPVPAFTLINGGKHAGNNLALRVIGRDNELMRKEAVKSRSGGYSIIFMVAVGILSFVVGYLIKQK